MTTWISVKKAARILNAPRHVVWSSVSRGKIEGSKEAGKEMEVSQESVMQFSQTYRYHAKNLGRKKKDVVTTVSPPLKALPGDSSDKPVFEVHTGRVVLKPFVDDCKNLRKGMIIELIEAGFNEAAVFLLAKE